MGDIEMAREMFLALEGCDDCSGEIARRAFCIQDRLATI